MQYTYPYFSCIQLWKSNSEAISGSLYAIHYLYNVLWFRLYLWSTVHFYSIFSHFVISHLFRVLITMFCYWFCLTKINISFRSYSFGFVVVQIGIHYMNSCHFLLFLNEVVILSRHYFNNTLECWIFIELLWIYCIDTYIFLLFVFCSSKMFTLCIIPSWKSLTSSSFAPIYRIGFNSMNRWTNLIFNNKYLYTEWEL